MVLILSFATCGILTSVWLVIILNWTRKLNNDSAPFWLFICALPLGWGSTILRPIRNYMSTHGGDPATIATLSVIIGIAAFLYLFMWLAAVYTTRTALQKYYNEVEPIGLKINGWLTFFCPTVYFQYHLSRIAEWKKTGKLPR